MTRERPLPTVIGPTENALRALLTRILSTTKIGDYPAWVVLNAAFAAGAQDPRSDWRRTVGDALKVDPDFIDEVLAQLAADGLVGVDGLVTAHGAAELAAARSEVAATTAYLVEGVSQEDQAAARRALDHMRRKAEDLLRA